MFIALSTHNITKLGMMVYTGTVSVECPLMAEDVNQAEGLSLGQLQQYDLKVTELVSVGELNQIRRDIDSIRSCLCFV